MSTCGLSLMTHTLLRLQLQTGITVVAVSIFNQTCNIWCFVSTLLEILPGGFADYMETLQAVRQRTDNRNQKSSVEFYLRLANKKTHKTFTFDDPSRKCCVLLVKTKLKSNVSLCYPNVAAYSSILQDLFFKMRNNYVFMPFIYVHKTIKQLHTPNNCKH